MNEKQEKVKKLINIMFDKFEEDLINAMEKEFTTINSISLMKYYKIKRKKILQELGLDN